MIAALRHTDLCSLAMPTNGEQWQGEREPFIITQERRGKCSAGKGEENRDNASCGFQDSSQGVFSSCCPASFLSVCGDEEGFLSVR